MSEQARTKWTTQRPTDPGWYFYRSTLWIVAPTIEIVRLHTDLQFYRAGFGRAWDPIDMLGDFILEPISVPGSDAP